ncbi:MAG TPA: TspO/MBR family protein [Patescibacteria group bacterium]|nr:TspO/MBR family protein [Patescibacteria group bacterium]
MNKIWKFIISIAVCQLAGAIGSFFTAPEIDNWYASLTRPSIAPPNWVFAPVWTTLFFLMGLAVYLVWLKGSDKKEVKLALITFDLQLLFNIFWSILFFGLQSPSWAFAEILVLLLLIALTIISFAKVSKAAAWLLAPYLVWVSLAVILNFQFWQLNY